jgi:hypothetical protein
MVEYALLLAGASLQAFAADVSYWASGINWRAVGYGLIGLVVLRVVVWALRPTDR